jgi:hypothetical protein
MRKLSLLFALFICTSSCDDGDIITVDIEFGDTFLSCGEIVFYQLKEFPYESLSLQITNPEITLDDLIQVDDNGNLIEDTFQYGINGSTNTFNYRTYNADPSNFFCNDVPPSDIEITEDLSSPSGLASISVSIIEDDEDGIPADIEDENLDGDDDPATNPTDRDGDGIPDYIDFDDDGDNVLTSTELDDDDLDGDGDPLTNPKDTDMDGIPNYLDTDDDNDGVLTINEENESQDQNPANDFTDPLIADYLNPVVANLIPATAYRTHIIDEIFTVELVVENIQFPTLNQDEFNFGKLINSALESTRLVTPDF